MRALWPRVFGSAALLGTLVASALRADAAAAEGAVPTVVPNRSIPGTDAFTRLAGGLMTLGLIGAGVGLVVSLGGLALAGHTHNIHLRERFKTGVLLSLVATVGFGAANRLLAWAFGIGGGF